MAKRQPISKKLRFEVFKRDSFTCQYCGLKAPDVILEVDHIKPVKEGGTNIMLNNFYKDGGNLDELQELLVNDEFRNWASFRYFMEG